MKVCCIAIKIRTANGWETLPTVKGRDGLTNYDLAVQNGFVGTELDWLNSIKGQQGAQGIQGPPGLSGNTYQFIYKVTTTNVTPSIPNISQDIVAPTGWSLTPLELTSINKYEWVSTRIRTNGIWGSYSLPALWAIYTDSGSADYTLPQASSATLGGIKADPKTTESTPVVIDTNGFLFVPESTGGSGGGIEDVPLETENPKYYARYSGDKTWKVLLPPEGSVGDLQQVTTNGATTTIKSTFVEGIVVKSILQIPNTPPTIIDAGFGAIYLGESGFDGTTPGGGSGTTIHNNLTGRNLADAHPTSAITGLDNALNSFSLALSALESVLNSKVNTSHLTDSEAHNSIFQTKANKHGDSQNDFAAKNITAETITMVENINQKLRIPKVSPSNPADNEFYLYIV